MKVIEYFTAAEELFELLQAACSEQTRYLVISTTFLYNRTSVHHDNYVVHNVRFSSWTRFKSANLNLWLDSEDELREWFERLKACLPGGTKICLAGERVNKIFQYYDYIEPSHPIRACVDLYLTGRDDDLLLNILSNRTECFEVRKGRFVVGRKSGGFKNSPIPTMPFRCEDDVGENEVLPVEISRGCAFNCAYCNYDKKTVNKLSYDQLRSQFEHSQAQFGCSKYYFTTECFSDNLDFVKLFHRVTKKSEQLVFDPSGRLDNSLGYTGCGGAHGQRTD